MDIRRQQGVTLVEMIVSLAILAVALLGAQILVIQSVRLGDMSHGTNVAVFDMNTVISHIREQPFEAVMDPTYLDSEGGARVPHGGVVDRTLYCYGDSGTTTHLTNQEIIAYYMGASGATLPLPTDKWDPLATSQISAPFETPDPLTFAIECTWTGANGDSRMERITAVRTR